MFGGGPVPVLSPRGTDASVTPGRVVFKLISTWHDRVLCLISARHGTERCMLWKSRHDTKPAESRTRHEEPLRFSGTTQVRVVADGPTCRVGAAAQPVGAAAVTYI